MGMMTDTGFLTYNSNDPSIYNSSSLIYWSEELKRTKSPLNLLVVIV